MVDVGFEVPKELADKALQLIEKAKDGGKIRKGANEATKSAERGEAKLIVIADDVNPPEIVMHLPIISKEKGTFCITVPTKAELGAAAGLPVGTAAIAVAEAGEGKKLLAEITKHIETLSKSKGGAAKEEKKETPKKDKTDKKPVKETKKEEEA